MVGFTELSTVRMLMLKMNSFRFAKRVLSAFPKHRGYETSSETIHKHFRVSSIPHALNGKPKKFFNDLKPSEYDEALGDHTGRQQNHIYSLEEIKEVRANLWKHTPTNIRDKTMNFVMYGLYHTFNFITGYKHVNPTPKSIEWRLIVLESVAGGTHSTFLLVSSLSLLTLFHPLPQYSQFPDLWGPHFAISRV